MSSGNGPSHDDQLIRIPKFVLEDRILGAWVGKSYGAAMGEPLEFAFNGRIFLGAVDVQEHALREWLVNEDDLYMNMAMLAVVADRGLAATSEDFAAPYREGAFLVWHANGQARQNLQHDSRPLVALRQAHHRSRSLVHEFGFPLPTPFDAPFA